MPRRRAVTLYAALSHYHETGSMLLGQLAGQPTSKQKLKGSKSPAILYFSGGPLLASLVGYAGSTKFACSSQQGKLRAFTVVHLNTMLLSIDALLCMCHFKRPQCAMLRHFNASDASMIQLRPLQS